MERWRPVCHDLQAVDLTCSLWIFARPRNAFSRRTYTGVSAGMMLWGTPAGSSSSCLFGLSRQAEQQNRPEAHPAGRNRTTDHGRCRGPKQSD